MVFLVCVSTACAHIQLQKHNIMLNRYMSTFSYLKSELVKFYIITQNRVHARNFPSPWFVSSLAVFEKHCALENVQSVRLRYKVPSTKWPSCCLGYKVPNVPMNGLVYKVIKYPALLGKFVNRYELLVAVQSRLNPWRQQAVWIVE